MLKEVLFGWGLDAAIAMLLMSLGLVETVKLVSGYEWVRSLRQISRQQQTDDQQRQVWWQKGVSF